MSRRVAGARRRRFSHGAAGRRRGAAPRAVRRAEAGPDDEHPRPGRRHRADPHRRPPDLPRQGSPRPGDRVRPRRAPPAARPRHRARAAGSTTRSPSCRRPRSTPRARRPSRRRRRAPPRCRESQENATTAALRQLGIPVQAQRGRRRTVTPVAVGRQAAQGRRRPVGRRHDGRRRRRAARRDHVARSPATTLHLVVRRDGRRVPVTVTTVAAADDGQAHHRRQHPRQG